MRLLRAFFTQWRIARHAVEAERIVSEEGHGSHTIDCAVGEDGTVWLARLDVTTLLRAEAALADARGEWAGAYLRHLADSIESSTNP